MLKKVLLCGAVAALLAGTAPVLQAQAQGFVLDPTNSRSNTSSSRDAQPAYKGGVLVPYAPSDSSAYGGRTRYRQQQQQPTGPIGYGNPKDRAGASVSPGLYGKNVGLSPEDSAQKERMDRIKSYKDKRKAENAVRYKEYNEKRMAERQAMLEAQKERDAYKNSKLDPNKNLPLSERR